MKDPDGRAVQRDPVFLAEAKIMDKSMADRLVGLTFRQSATAAATARLTNPDIAVTLYSEAAAKGTYTGSVYVSSLAVYSLSARWSNWWLGYHHPDAMPVFGWPLYALSPPVQCH
jgi:hypothetical protein